MMRLSHVLLCSVVGVLAWMVIQAGCAPEDPCRLCRSDELCNGTSCVKLAPPDGSPQDGVATDQPVTDTPSSDVVAPPPDVPPGGCTGDNQCEFGTKCVEGKCVPEGEPPPPREPTPDASSDGKPTDGPAPTEQPVGDQTPDAPPADRGTNPDSPPADRAAPDQPACQKDDDCASTHECKSGQCVRKPAPCDPACPTGATCTNGTCERVGSSPKLGELCGPNSKCQAGQTCLDVDRSSSYCFQDCADSKECANNPLGKACVNLTQTQKFCVDVVKLGDKCGFVEGLQALCPSSTICSNGICTKPQEVRRYDKCGVNAQVCPKGMICLRFSGASHGYCVDPCTPGNNSTCPDNGSCTTLSGGSGACIPSGTAGHDVLCGGSQTGSSLDRGKICKPGLECVQLAQAVCMEFWTGDCSTAGKTCPSGRTCQGLNGSGGQKFGGCFANCVQDKCSESHLECRKNFSNTCWPKSP